MGLSLEEEAEAFRALQLKLADIYARVFPDPALPRTVLIVPSLTLDTDVLSRITGVTHYEERLLCLLLLLRMPATHVVYVTSAPIDEATVDYYLHLLEGIPHRHARARLTLLSCHDSSVVPLSDKILSRPRLLKRIGDALGDRSLAHMVCFNVTPLERRLALALGIPIYGCDPELLHFGSKSGSRKLFREAGVAIPDGRENLKNEDDVVAALVAMRTADPDLRRAVIKLNEGFSGEGNATFDFEGAPEGAALAEWVRDRLECLRYSAGGMDWTAFSVLLGEMGGIAEAFVEGPDKRSPSVQFRVDPTGKVEAISTHDQVLGGRTDQEYLGALFPADAAYRMDIQAEGMKAARMLAGAGVLGRFGIDFISVREGNRWVHRAIEINLRKGGTTHPFLMLQYLTSGSYDADTGEFIAPDGRPRCYYATDNLESECYRGLAPDDLIDIAVRNGIHFHAATATGVVFHMIGALSQHGKLGAVCVGHSPEDAERIYREMVAVLDRECGKAK